MKLKFSKKYEYSEVAVVDEIVRARLFEDYDNLDASDNEAELRAAYEVVLRYNTVCTDKRLKKLANNF